MKAHIAAPKPKEITSNLIPIGFALRTVKSPTRNRRNADNPTALHQLKRIVQSICWSSALGTTVRQKSAKKEAGPLCRRNLTVTCLSKIC